MSDGAEAPLGIIGKAKLEEYLKVGNTIRIKTEKADSFGRWLADFQHEGASLSKILSDLGYGVLRPGKKKGEKSHFDPARPYLIIASKLKP